MANFTTSINATCADLIGLQTICRNCQAITICSGDDIVVSTGYTSSIGTNKCMLWQIQPQMQ